MEVAVSGQFFGWVFALGENIRVIGPKEIIERFKAEVYSILSAYG